MPILNNIGNVLYVVVALAGGILLLSGAPNLSISGLALSLIHIFIPKATGKALGIKRAAASSSTRPSIRLSLIHI